jgi:hypothetical protein
LGSFGCYACCAEGDHGERGGHKPEPRPQAESLANQTDDRRAEQEAAISGGRYRCDGQLGESPGDLPGCAEQDRNGVREPQPDRDEA